MNEGLTGRGKQLELEGLVIARQEFAAPRVEGSLKIYHTGRVVELIPYEQPVYDDAGNRIIYTEVPPRTKANRLSTIFERLGNFAPFG